MLFLFLVLTFNVGILPEVFWKKLSSTIIRKQNSKLSQISMQNFEHSSWAI